MYFSAIFLPLLSFLVSASCGRFLGWRGVSIFTTSCTFFTLFLSLLIFYEVCFCQSNCSFKVISWMVVENFVVSWGFLFDSLSASMCVVVTSVSALVHLYATSYMEQDPHLSRFMSYLSLFTFFMLVLVSADNFAQMFVGWEGVGLVSYLLISFWNVRIQANKAAIKAMLVNRVGDLGLCLALCCIFFSFHSLDYAAIFASSFFLESSSFSFLGYPFSSLNFICFFLFWGAVGKSAQLGLHTWLPDAMEGPTPVSALIHAATMVTAGVFVIIRSAPLFELAPSVLSLVCVVGASTALFAASTGLVQNDMKKVIAYSTCSQLGYMVFACGLSQYSLAFFHLANHAFFKALLFLSAGCIIHGVCDEQDMRKMALGKIFSFTYSFILLGSLALTGFPFLTGFYSKDTILELALVQGSWSSAFAHLFGLLAAFCTSFYSYRLLHLSFLNSGSTFKVYAHLGHEASFAMSLPLVVLSFGAIFIGFLTKDLFIGLGTDAWTGVVFGSLFSSVLVEAEFLPAFLKHIPLALNFLGLLLTFAVISSSTSLSWKRSFFGFLKSVSFAVVPLQKFLCSKWHFDQVFNEFLVHKIMSVGYKNTFLVLDKGFIEQLGPFGVLNASQAFLTNFSKAQTGFLYHYVLFFILSVAFFIQISISSFFLAQIGFHFFTFLALSFSYFVVSISYE